MFRKSNLEVFNHDNDTTVILHKLCSIELESWIMHIKFINDKIRTLINLITSYSLLNSDIKDIKYTLDKKNLRIQIFIPLY